MTPLLKWKQHAKPKVAYTLLGSTFSSRMKGSDQWFNRLAVQADGKTVLDVEIGAPKAPGHQGEAALKTMTVKVDKKYLEQDSVFTHTGMFQVTRHTRPQKPSIGKHEAERVRLHWGHGYEFEISSAAADFPKHPDLQERWAHLNLHFSTLPSGSSGMLAELAGLSPMGQATRALVSKANDHASNELNLNHGHELREHGVSLRSISLAAPSLD